MPTGATPPYGPPISLDQAKRVMAAAELEAAKNSWQVGITILDSGGNLVMFHKVDNAQLSAITTSEGKARTALEFKLPSKALDDAIANGGAGMRLLALKDITPLQGGILVRSTARSSAPSASPARCRCRTSRSPKPAPTHWASRACDFLVIPGRREASSPESQVSDYGFRTCRFATIRK